MTSIDQQCGCADLQAARGAALSRRSFLAAGAAAGAVATTASLFGDTFRQVAYGATTSTNVLVVLSLRGGIDGMGVVVPHGDPAYYRKRPTIGVPQEKLLRPDAMFGLHPALAPLAKWWDAGQLAAVQAVGMAAPNRSHFSAMEEIEDADPTSSVRRGWVNRMIGLDTDPSPTQAVHFTSTTPPTLLAGPAATLAAGRLSQIKLAGADPEHDDATARKRRRASLATVWGKDGSLLGQGVRSAMTVTQRLDPVTHATYTPQNGAAYPTAWPAGELSDALKDTAQLIRAGVGAQVVSIDYGSFDLHTDYGNLEWGSMQRLLGAVAGSLDAFLTDLGPLGSQVTVVTISEFGRRLGENGARGLDHGWGNMMLLLGGGVKGGRYYGTWPGLTAPNKLVDDDLAVTTDYRDVLGEVVARRFPALSAAKVFPGHQLNPLGVMA